VGTFLWRCLCVPKIRHVRRYGSRAMLREIGRYAFAVVGLSAAVNLGLVTVLADFDPTLNKITAVAAAAVPAALVAWFVSTRVLRIGVPLRK
jgi:putative flippase GtrA